MDEGRRTSPERDELARLEEQVARYREAAEQTLQQLDYCIDYLQGRSSTKPLARQVRANQRRILGQIRRS